MPALDMAKFAKFCKDMGFIYQSSEIYGGINGFWDYGPLGVELKRNVKEAWWQDMVRNPPPGPDGQEIRMVGLDCSIIMNPKVWVASGHVGGFSDPMVDCLKCQRTTPRRQTLATSRHLRRMVSDTMLDAMLGGSKHTYDREARRTSASAPRLARTSQPLGDCRSRRHG